MDLLRQATAARGDHFLAGAGGFGTNQLTVPLGIPASELARIAQTVPDPNHVPGEPTSGTGSSGSCTPNNLLFFLKKKNYDICMEIGTHWYS